jgi:hypothetical protein
LAGGWGGGEGLVVGGGGEGLAVERGGNGQLGVRGGGRGSLEDWGCDLGCAAIFGLKQI